MDCHISSDKKLFQKPCAVVLSHGFSTEKSPQNVDQCFALRHSDTQYQTA